jgi:hypothetical protein
MGGITITNIFFALIGFVINVGLRLQKDVVVYKKGRKKKGTNNFLKFWWEENQIKTYTSILMILVLLYYAPSLFKDGLGCQIREDSNLYTIYSLTVGYATYSIWFQFINNAKRLIKK